MKQLFFLLLFITVYTCTAISQTEEPDPCETFIPGEIIQSTDTVCWNSSPSTMTVNKTANSVYLLTVVTDNRPAETKRIIIKK